MTTTSARQDHLDGLWGLHPTLLRIRNGALSRMLRPESVLGAVLAYVNARTPVGWVLPPIIGAPGSLNLVVVTYGRSGLGKSSSASLAEEITGTQREVWDPEVFAVGGRGTDVVGLCVTPLGSGEGIAQAWFEWVTVPGQTTKGKARSTATLIRVRDSVLICDPEGSVLGAQLGRSGATIGTTLLKLFSGEDLAFSYSKRGNSTATPPTLAMPPLSYRAAVLLGIQADNVETFLQLAGSGWPQRILWTTAEGSLPDALPDWSGPLDWCPPPKPDDRTFITVDPTIGAHLVARHRAYRDGTADNLDSHGGLVRLKVAATVHALLYPGQAPQVTTETWDLAEMICAASDGVRDAARRHVAGIAAEAADRRDTQAANRAVNIKAAEAAEAEERVARVIYRITDRHSRTKTDHQCAPSKCLQHGVASKDRHLFAAALERALEAGWVTEINTPRGPRFLPGTSAPRTDTR